jgi:hypothetical protein
MVYLPAEVTATTLLVLWTLIKQYLYPDKNLKMVSYALDTETWKIDMG